MPQGYECTVIHDARQERPVAGCHLALKRDQSLALEKVPVE